MRGLRGGVFVLALVLGAPAMGLSAETAPEALSPPAVAAPEIPMFIGALPAAVLDASQVVQAPSGPPPTPRHTGIVAMVKGIGEDVTHLPSLQNLFIFGVGGALALSVHPLDDNVQRKVSGNTTAQNVFKAGQVTGSTYTLLATSVAVYAFGRIKDEPKVSHLGMDLIRSLAIAQGMTQLLKYTTRRERPDLSGRTSFPSGHAADTFAFATALERHLGWRGAVPAYIVSSYVAISRLPSNRHWLSDTVFGATVGIVAGRTVTRHGREYPIALASVPGGAALMYVHHGD
jgi:hypothetical protein